MACSWIPHHVIAVNVYFVDHESEATVESAVGNNSSINTKILYPIIQVKARRCETAASVLYRVHHYIAHTSVGCISMGYSPYTLVYNGQAYNIRDLGTTAIGTIVNDPKSSLTVLDGSMVIANCLCLNPCIIGCISSQPSKPAHTEDPNFQMIIR